MRRKIAMLTLAVAAGTLSAGAPAEAYPICARAYSSSDTPSSGHIDTGYTCVPYEYGVICHVHHAYSRRLDVDVTVEYCIPAG